MSLLRIQEIGTPAEFVTTDSTYDETTDDHTGFEEIIVRGHVSMLGDDLAIYRKLSLTIDQTVTLLFIPDVVDDEPAMGSKIMWNDVMRVVRHIQHFRPSGHAIGAKVIVS